MTFWTIFWAGLLVVCLSVFAVLAIVVTIRGAYDLRELFRSIQLQHDMPDGERSDDDDA